MFPVILILGTGVFRISQAQSTTVQNATSLASNGTLSIALNNTTYSISSSTTSSQSISSDAVTSTSSIGVGDYVASGILLSSTTLSTISTSSGNGAGQDFASTQVSSNSSLLLSQGRSLSATVANSSTSLSSLSSGLPPTVSPTAPVYALSNATTSSTIPYPTGSNQSSLSNATDPDICWQAWQTYWSLSAAQSTQYASESVLNNGSYITLYTTATITYPGFAGVDTTTTETVDGFTDTYYATSSFEGVAYTTVSTVASQDGQTWTLVDSEASIPPSTVTATEEIVSTIADVVVTTYLPPNVTTPACALPSSYSKCQDQWDSWVSAELLPIPQPPAEAGCYPQGNYSNPTSAPPLSTPACYAQWSVSLAMWSSMVSSERPICTQAAFPDAACTSLKDVYVSGQNLQVWPEELMERYYDGEMAFDEGSISFEGLDQMWAATAFPNYNTDSWYWPSTAQLAPGCTLDCGRCAVTGGVVQLLYFPPGLSHPATGPVIASTLGTAFTSPTIYISFSDIHAGDACGTVGPTIQSTILAFPTESTLMSQWAVPTLCDGHDPIPRLSSAIFTATASFNLSDILTTPVPYSIRTSQPSCAISIAGDGLYQSCDPNACISDTEYKPILVVPDAFLQSLYPGWASCSANIQGLYDPPKSLTPQSAEAGPTTPTAVSATIAPTPASGVTVTAAASTGSAQTVLSTPSQTGGSAADSPSSTAGIPSSGDPATANAQSPAASTSGLKSVTTSASNVESETSTNALDVLSAALSTFAASSPSLANSQQAPAQDPSTGIVLTGTSGNLVTAIQQGSALIVSGSTAVATLVPGSGTTVDGVALSISSANPPQPTVGVVVVGQTQVLSLTSLPAPSNPPAATVGSAQVLTGSNGQTETLAHSNSAVLVIDGSTTQILAPGAAFTTLNGVVVSADPEGNVHANNGASSLVLTSGGVTANPTIVYPTAAANGIIATGTDGVLLTIVQEGSSAVALQSGHTIATLLAGSITVLDGLTISAPVLSSTAGARTSSAAVGGVVVNGHTVQPSNLSGLSGATIAQSAAPFITATGSDGQAVTILRQGSSIVIENGRSTTSILAANVGSTAVVFDGVTISIPSATSSGKANQVVVNGKTVTLAASTPVIASGSGAPTSSTISGGSSTAGAGSAASSTQTRSSGGSITSLISGVLMLTLGTMAIAVPLLLCS